MELTPLIKAALPIQAHAYAAMSAFVIGIFILMRTKGTISHKSLGWIWVGLMLVVATTSFWIHEINQWGGLSLIHLLSILTLITLPYALWHIRRGDRQRHAKAMITLFCGALVIAGAFTLMPGRIMHDVVFGPEFNQSDGKPARM